MHKNTVVECANLHIKQFILDSSNMVFILEQWQVEVESIERRVKILKILFFGIFRFRSGNHEWKDENVRRDEMNQSGASILFSEIRNP